MAAKVHRRWTKDGCDVKGRLHIIYLSDLSDIPPPLSSVSSGEEECHSNHVLHTGNPYTN